MKTISDAEPEAGAGVAEVACVRADMSLKTGLRLAVAVRRNSRAAAIAICSERNKPKKSTSESLWLNEKKQKEKKRVSVLEFVFSLTVQKKTNEMRKGQLGSRWLGKGKERRVLDIGLPLELDACL